MEQAMLRCAEVIAQCDTVESYRKLIRKTEDGIAEKTEIVGMLEKGAFPYCFMQLLQKTG